MLLGEISSFAKSSPERAVDTSVGQRPTYGAHNRIKAVGLAYHDNGMDFFHSLIRKAYSLETFYAVLRRALPYADMRKAFGLVLGYSKLCASA